MSHPIRWRRRAQPFLIALVTLLAMPSVALADAELVQAVPQDGDVLTESPPAVTLRFDEEIDPDRSSV
ncbi:MAG: copper resistance protein CopC [Chloroflexi bacterium]|nr:copper resistance protein CopC [Chloroflexota bacterium]